MKRLYILQVNPKLLMLLLHLRPLFDILNKKYYEIITDNINLTVKLSPIAPITSISLGLKECTDVGLGLVNGPI